MKKTWKTLTTITSDKKGFYSYTWDSMHAGKYYIKALLVGNDYNNVESNIVSLFIKKAPLSIVLQVTKTTLDKEETIEVSGSLSPPLSLTDIMVTYEKPNGSKEEHIIKTNKDERFSDSIVADLVGEWKAKASWSGNEDYYMNASSLTNLTVTVSSAALTSTPISMPLSTSPSFSIWLVALSSVIGSILTIGITITIKRIRRKQAPPLFSVSLTDVEREIKKYEGYLEKLEQLRREGKVSETVYEKLKEEYGKKLEELLEKLKLNKLILRITEQIIRRLGTIFPSY